MVWSRCLFLLCLSFLFCFCFLFMHSKSILRWCCDFCDLPIWFYFDQFLPSHRKLCSLFKRSVLWLWPVTKHFFALTLKLVWLGRAVGAKKSQSEFSEFELKNIVLKLRFFELKSAKLRKFCLNSRFKIFHWEGAKILESGFQLYLVFMDLMSNSSLLFPKNKIKIFLILLVLLVHIRYPMLLVQLIYDVNFGDFGMWAHRFVLSSFPFLSHELLYLLLHMILCTYCWIHNS